MKPEGPVTTIPLPIWGDIRSARLDDGRLVRLAVLEAIDDGLGAEGVWDVICKYYDERKVHFPSLSTADATAYEFRRKLKAPSG